MTEPLTPREFAERALLGTLLMEPGRVIAIAEWLHETDFRTPTNGTVFAHLRDMVAGAEQATPTRDAVEAAWVMYTQETDIGPWHARTVAGSTRILRVSRSPFTDAEIQAERKRTGLGYDLKQVQLWVPADTSYSELASHATHQLEQLPAFDAWEEVIGDDIVVGSVAYSADVYAPDGEGGVRELTDDERAARRSEGTTSANRRPEDLPGDVAEVRAAAMIVGDESIPGTTPSPFAITGVDAVSLYLRIANSGELGARSITAPHLHTLMATAPPSGRAQPEAYARMILEASIRRDVEHAGMRIGQVNRYGPELTELLQVLESALDQIDHAQRRWEAVSDSQNRLTRVLDTDPTAPARPPTPASIGAALGIFDRAPDVEDIKDAEERLLGHVLKSPSVLDGLIDRLLPEDFANQNIAAAYRAAIEVHISADRAVDAVTVAWEQQRRAERYGPGLPVNNLLRLATEPTPNNTEWVADIVMRGALSRLTAAAAENVRKVAQHPGLQPSDVLHTANMSYEAVRATAARMTGPPSTATQLDGFGGLSADDRGTSSPDSGAGRSFAQIIELRERSTRLRVAFEGEAGEPGRSGPIGDGRLSGRATHSEGVEQTDDQWIPLPGGGVRFLDTPEMGSAAGQDFGPDCDA